MVLDSVTRKCELIMKQRMLLSLASALLCGLMTTTDGQAQTRGNFSLSCTNVTIKAANAFAVPTVLTADCKRKDKSTNVGATIDLNNYITNNGGFLLWGRGGNFGGSCSEI